MARIALLLCGGLLAASVARPAGADEAEAVRFVYEAPPVCPDAEGFVKEVHARTTRFQIVGAGAGVRSFEVRIASSGSAFRGLVRVVDARGVASERTVDAAQCEELVRTLALVTATSIDPKALASAPPSPSADSAPPTPTEPATTDPSLPLPAPTTADPSSLTSARAPRETPAPPIPVLPKTRPWHLDIGLGAYAEGLAAPATVVGETAFVSLTIDTQHLLSPAFRLGVAHASSALSADPGSMSLDWTVGRAEICPTRWPAQGPLDVRPCVASEVGVLSASATGISKAESHVRPWGTLGALALLEWEPLRPIVVDAEFSLSAALVRDQFGVVPSPVVYEVPVLVPAAAIALGVRFP